MEMLQIFLLVSQIIIAIILIFVVLMQKNEESSVGSLGASSDTMLGKSISAKRSSVEPIVKFTIIISALFILNCLLLAFTSIKLNKTKSDSKIDNFVETSSDEVPQGIDNNLKSDILSTPKLSE